MRSTRSWCVAAVMVSGVAMGAIAIPRSAADDQPPENTPAAESSGEKSNGLASLVDAGPVVNRPREGMPLDIAPDEANRRGEVLSAVKQLASLDVKEMPLRNAIREITAKLPIRVKFDQKAIDDDGTVSLDDPVTHSTENEPVESILFDLLKPRGLTWIPRGDSLVITTMTEADANLETIAYDVTDIVVAEDGQASFGDLINTITLTVDPDSWMDVGGAGSLVPLARERAALLIVRQSFAIQRKIASFLTGLHRTGVAAPYPSTGRKIRLVPPPPPGPALCGDEVPTKDDPTPATPADPSAAKQPKASGGGFFSTAP